MFVAVGMETSLKFPFFHVYFGVWKLPWGAIVYGNTTFGNNGLIEHKREGEPAMFMFSLVTTADIPHTFIIPVVSKSLFTKIFWDLKIYSLRFNEVTIHSTSIEEIHFAALSH